MTDVLTVRDGTMDRDVIRELAQDVYHVQPHVRSGDIVLDVGGYIGTFAEQVLRLVPGARVISIEPMPDNFRMLQQNVGGRVTALNVALVGECRNVTMYDFGPDASACHSVFDLSAPDAKPVMVEGMTLEGVFVLLGLQSVRFMKLDCQGAEFEIIALTPPCILRKIDYIAMEVHRSIAKTGHVIGEIPKYWEKTALLHRTLFRTHTPIHRHPRHPSIEVWANRRLVSTGFWFVSYAVYLAGRMRRSLRYRAGRVARYALAIAER